MNKHEIMSLIESMIDDSKTAVLATVDTDNMPHMRWITPGCFQQRPGAIYMLSNPEFSKVDHIRNNPKVEMMFQTKALDKVMNVRGRVNILDNPSIRSEVLECVARNLGSFWRINSEERDLAVLELIIEEATLYLPGKGSRVTVEFGSDVSE